ncbi:DUF1326 domain-containing protein [Shewanella sp. Isolate13]|uniref:DUF1326 domain-containing protein n=1 Tax=Shewanella sp. Isolate13 TaxID=2908531 RepID=UPI001EFE29BB|nr:DUF1326 domain-containing protein [Shewanella sp. Isolate13]MCG9731160.1 DUF1326 domain-containing protein [Shewanella sp. Isolate13]
MSADSNNWSLNMHQIETCNCNHGCGCQFAGFPDFGSCEALLGFMINHGHLNQIKLDGLKLVLALKWPGAIHEGNGTCILFIDSSATEEQVTALATIFSGAAGGMPLEALASTFTTVVGPVIVDINMDTSEESPSFDVDGIMKVQQKPLLNPVTGENQHVHISFPDGGFIWNDGRIGTTESMWLKHDALSFNHPGKFAAKANVQWPNG